MRAVALLAIVLAASLASPAWNQEIEFTATDQNGFPVEGADITLTYQKANSFQSDDGILAGRTDGDGHFFANLTSVVPAGYDSKSILVEVSHFYGGSFKRTETADSPLPKLLNFSFPFAQEKMRVAARSIDNFPLKGVSVFLTGPAIKKITGEEGTADFSTLAGAGFSGFVTYKGNTVTFSSSGAEMQQGVSVVSVEVPVIVVPDNRTIKKVILLNFRPKGLDGRNLTAQEVRFLHLGNETAVQTDSRGLAAFTTDEAGMVNVTLLKYEHIYNYSYNLTKSRNETVTLTPLMKLNSFTSAMEAEENCYMVLGNVTDPRVSVPREGRIIRLLPGFNSSQIIGMDEHGFFATRVCVTKDLYVRLNVSNKYESVVSKPLYLHYAPPKPPANTTAAKKETDWGEVGLSVAAVIIVGSLSTFLIVRRRDATRLARFVIAYFRQVVLKTIGADKRKKPTPKAAVVVSTSKLKDIIEQKIEAAKEEEMEKQQK